MADDTKRDRKQDEKAARVARRAAALRANLHRRKAQTRARGAPAKGGRRGPGHARSPPRRRHRIAINTR